MPSVQKVRDGQFFTCDTIALLWSKKIVHLFSNEALKVIPKNMPFHKYKSFINRALCIEVSILNRGNIIYNKISIQIRPWTLSFISH